MGDWNTRARWLLALPGIAVLTLALVACEDRGEKDADAEVARTAGDEATPSRTAAATTPSLPDADGDGVVDADDACPREDEDGRWSDGSDGCPDGLAELTALAASDINAFWAREFDEQGADYTAPAGFTGYEGPVETGCGTATPYNAFYCPLDHSIYFDADFLGAELEGTGDFGPVFVIAHEWGHLVQANLGILVDPDRFSIQNELQADCFAGVYTSDAEERGLLEEGDLDEAVTSLLAAGDPDDTPWYDPQAHGTSEERVQAFAAGMEGGVEACLGI
ncbi:MAG: neutral zinc metallopeptidase [Dehalococcoidia bacterium]|nr:neutral zinc metallopeptidase [Dehalococcoidia bacterium]